MTQFDDTQAQGDSPGAAYDEATALPFSPAAFILIADIEGFSPLPDAQQRYLSPRLWSFVEAHPLVRRLGDECPCNGTGDGILVAATRNDANVEHGEFLALAEEIVDHMAGGAYPCRVRVGVHEGPLRRIDGLGKTQVVGTGPNICARVTSIGDGGQVIVSERFVQSYVDEVGASVLSRFEPGVEEAPIEVFVKHGESVRIRQLVAQMGRSSRPQGAIERARTAPGKLEALQHVESRIRQRLVRIERGIVEALGQLDPHVTPSTLSTRVSLLAPQGSPGERVLSATSFRFHRHSSFVGRGMARYSLEGDGAGPPGRAFVDRKVIALTRLSPFDCDKPDLYCRKLVTRWGLETSNIVAWQRKPRSLIAIPIGIRPDKTDAVICIDLDDPLANVPIASVRKVAERMMVLHGEALAALWALRMVTS